MTLELYYHPLSSFCWKALTALYENETAFSPRYVDLSDPEDREALERLWPPCKFPVLHDRARDWVVPEASSIIEYLALHYPGRSALVPSEPDLARRVRTRDRFFDNHLHVLMQKVVADRIRPPTAKDPVGVDDAKRRMIVALGMAERDMGKSTWAVGEEFGMADCSAAPALFYANKVLPFGTSYPNLTAYLARLSVRPSFARVLKEAEPYFAQFPTA